MDVNIIFIIFILRGFFLRFAEKENVKIIKRLIFLITNSSKNHDIEKKGKKVDVVKL